MGRHETEKLSPEQYAAAMKQLEENKLKMGYVSYDQTLNKNNKGK